MQNQSPGSSNLPCDNLLFDEVNELNIQDLPPPPQLPANPSMAYEERNLRDYALPNLEMVQGGIGDLQKESHQGANNEFEPENVAEPEAKPTKEHELTEENFCIIPKDSVVVLVVQEFNAYLKDQYSSRPEGATWETISVRRKKEIMFPIAKIWIQFLCTRIARALNVFNVNTFRAVFLYVVLQKKQVFIGTWIYHCMKRCISG
ncbi:hypothetical protein Godav_017948, partial [Gossypium davidsonii]|nr:hypothetical protein [Gossypium davidsonii]